ncbi:MAG: ribosomal protein S18-alanine N-acetyltransferase [Chloroflexi bacterium]|nr:ribosomal protein S18-alanine N-acetyltransferase [Chloroflexota bacterium]
MRDGIMDFAIRPMRVEDLSQVAEIERQAFPTTWPPTPFRRELGNNLARYLVAWSPSAKGVPPSLRGDEQSTSDSWFQRLTDSVLSLFGAAPERLEPETHGLVVGYVATWFVLDEAHIISIAVRESLRRLGLGELLMMAAVELSMARRAQRVTLEARVSNLAAHALYEKYGFARVGLRKRYYSDNNEDALIMTADGILSPAYQAKFQALVEAYHQRRGHAMRILA